MSVDSPTSAGEDPSWTSDCSLCGQRLGDDDRFVTCYPEAGRSVPARAADDGVLAFCGACTTEVDELVDAWTGHDEPPVDDEWPIGHGYRRVTDDCSFCNRSLGEAPVLGVEYYRRGAAYDDATGTCTNYSLCDGCATVFDEFLDQVGEDGGA